MKLLFVTVFTFVLLTSPLAVFGASSTLIEVIDYYPYGEIRFDEKFTSFDEKRKFTGHEFDADTGLNYMNARYQDGVKGQFISHDPTSRDNPEKFLEDPQQFNSYSYASGNPLTHTDPSGLWVNKGDGSFIAEKGDTLAKLQQETGRNWHDTDFSRDPRTLRINEAVSFGRTASNNNPTIDSTGAAVMHYYNKKGVSVNLGSNTQKALQNSSEQKMHQNRIISGQTTLDEGNYGVDLTKDAFFVGKTVVNYNTTRGTKYGVTIFSGFEKDGFWDILPGKGDGIGPKKEVPGGTPYAFNPFAWVMSYSITK